MTESQPSMQDFGVRNDQVLDRGNFSPEELSGMAITLLEKAKPRFVEDSWRGGIGDGEGPYDFDGVLSLFVRLSDHRAHPRRISKNSQLAMAEALEFAGVRIPERELTSLREQARQEQVIKALIPATHALSRELGDGRKEKRSTRKTILLATALAVVAAGTWVVHEHPELLSQAFEGIAPRISTTSPVSLGETLRNPVVSDFFDSITKGGEETALTPELPPDFSVFDFSPGAEPISMTFTLPDGWIVGDGKTADGKEITLTFKPGGTSAENRCQYLSRKACIDFYQSPLGTAVYYVGVHSGVGSIGQALRDAFEGTSFNKARLTLTQVFQNLQGMVGAEARMAQGELVVEGYRVVFAVRVPPGKRTDYYMAQPENALAIAAEDNPELASFVDPDKPLLWLETSGWLVGDDRTLPGSTRYTNAVYVVGIQQP